MDAHACMISTGWRLICWSSSLSTVPFSSCSKSQYRGTVTSSSRASQASCRVSFPPCGSYAEVARILLTFISLICAWKGKTYRHSTDLAVYSPIRVNRGKLARTPRSNVFACCVGIATSEKLHTVRLSLLAGNTREIFFVFQESSLAMKEGRIRGTYNMKCKYEKTFLCWS